MYETNYQRIKLKIQRGSKSNKESIEPKCPIKMPDKNALAKMENIQTKCLIKMPNKNA